MIRAKHYTDTNSVEVTWIDEDGRRTRCHSYDQYQMDMLREDLGPAASEYDAIIAEVLAHQVPLPPEANPVVESISLAQARAQLITLGLLDLVLAFIASIPDPVKKALAENDIEYRNEVLRGHGMVLSLQTMLGWTDTQVDEFFTAAAKL